MKKKTTVILAVMLLSLGLLFAGGESESAEESRFPRKSIGVIYSSFTDELGSSYKQSLESLASYFNIEFKFVETGYNTEEGQALSDAMLQSGVDGVIAVSPTVSLLDAAEKNNIAVVGLNEPVDEATAAQFKAYVNYLGAVPNDDYNIGQKAAQVLYNAGCRNICITCLTAGTSKNHDDRYRGFKEEIAKHPEVKILAENASRAQWSAAINTFAAAYPEMDGIFMTACSEPAYQAIKKNGLIGKVVIATADISESTVDYIENGTIKMIAGGQYNRAMLAFAVLYNYLYDGTVIITNESKSYSSPFIFIESREDYENYQKYVNIIETGKAVYSPEYIASLIKGLNPEMTPEKFEAECAAYSLENVMAGMGK